MPPHQTSTVSAQHLRADMRNQALPSPDLQSLSQTNYKSKQAPDYPSRLDKCHCRAGGHLLNIGLPVGDHTSHQKKEKTGGPQLLSQIPDVPENLQCPNPDQPCRGTKAPFHRSGCHLLRFQASFETSQR